MKKGTFGEPWRECPHTGHIRAAGKWDRKDEMPYGFDFYMEPRVHDWPTIRNRIGTCVNALAGIENPQNLRSAWDAYLLNMDSSDPQCRHIAQQAIDTIRAMMGGQHD
jgi:hypothetical protein